MGYEVSFLDEELSRKLDHQVNEYLYENTQEGFTVFDTGSYMTGDDIKTFLVIDNPMQHGIDLTLSKAAIDIEIDRLGLKAVGDFGLVGGMLVS
jgi:hypothetical protein